MRTLGQKRAAFALSKVLSLACDKEEFKAFSAGAPSMILQNGFGQAMAFWLSKGKDNGNNKHIVLFDIIKEWLSFKNGDVNNQFMTVIEDRPGFIEELSKIEQSQYLDAQKETLALLEWVKRYANAEFHKE